MPIRRIATTLVAGCAAAGVSAFAQTTPDGIVIDHVHPMTGDQLGYEVIEHDEFVIAAALSDREPGSCVGGYVHIYRRTASGLEPYQRISPSRPTICNLWHYGRSMAVIDEFLFIGCPGADAPDFGSGLIEVHERTSAGYVLVQTILGLPGQGETALLGQCMEPRDGKLWASMPGADITSANSGAVVCLERQAGQWTLAEVVPAPEPDILSGFFGFTFEGDRLIGSDGLAEAFVMARDGSGTWVLLDRFVSSSDNSYIAMAADGGWLLVGDANYNVGSDGGPGRVLAYVWNGSRYVLTQDLRPSLPTIFGSGSGEHFGYDLDVGAGRALISARNTYYGGIAPEGAAYVFELQGTQWVETRRIEPPVSMASSSAEEGLYFGQSVHMGDDVDIIGMTYYYHSGTYAGGAFIYERAIGGEFCGGVPNSTGSPATLELFGSRYVSANDLDATARGLPPGTFAVTVVARGTGSTQLPGTGPSPLCVDTQTLTRLPVRQADAAGAATWSLDPAGLPGPLGSGVAPGETIVAQTWYRDMPQAQPPANLSNAVSLALR